MADTYTQSYGAVSFYELDGTLLFNTVDTYGLWTSVDNEPSPDIKWLRVDVPGSDGSVDLSRALTGDVMYKQREIELQFIGERADHAAGVSFLRSMRAMLHGARLRIVTVLTRLANGYYIADCECDGTVHPDGTVVIDVKAYADPFIHTGTNHFTLPPSRATVVAPDSLLPVDDNHDLNKGAGTISVSMGTDSNFTPKFATSGKLWYACGDSQYTANLFDITNYSVFGYDNDGEGGFTYNPSVRAVGSAIETGALDGGMRVMFASALKRTGYLNDGFAAGGIPFLSGHNYNIPTCYVGVYMTGKVDSFGTSFSPFISLASVLLALETDEHGFPVQPVSWYNWEDTRTWARTLTAGETYYDELVAIFQIDRSAIGSYPTSMAMLGLTFGGFISSDGLQLRLSAYTSDETFPEHWQAPRIGYVPVDFGGTFARCSGVTDTVDISPLGVVTTHLCAQDSSGFRGYDMGDGYTTEGAADGWLPQDAQMICFTVTNSYGEDCATCMLGYTWHEMRRASAVNSAMRSTPSIESSDGAYVRIGDNEMFVGPGLQELSALTIDKGPFSLDFATFGTSNVDFSWEGGVL